MGSDPAATIGGRVSALARAMRALGSAVSLPQVLTAHRALLAVDPASPRQAKLALRAVLCSSREDLARFETAFGLAFGETPTPIAVAPEPGGGEAAGAGEARPGEAVEPGPEERGTPQGGARWSTAAVLREKDFASLTAGEREQVAQAIARLATIGPTRPRSRTRPGRRGRRIDLRRLVRSRLRAGRPPLRPDRREPTFAPRRLVLVCDSSRSMAAYSRLLLRFGQACSVSRRRVEAFVFSTRLTRVTNELRSRDLDRGLTEAMAAVDDWESGTRIGESLASLTHEYSSQLGRGATVIVFSDGWDRGDPELLGAEIERIRRCAHRVLWVDPNASREGFEPLTRGMQTALGSVDRLCAGASLADLEDVVDLIEASDAP